MAASTFLRVFETNFTDQYPAVKRNIFILPKWFFRAGVGKARSEKHSPKEFSARYLYRPLLRPVLSSDDDGEFAHRYLVWRANGLDDGITLTAGRQVVDEDGL